MPPVSPPEAETVSDYLANAVRTLGFSPSGNVETFQLVLGLLAALLAYFLIHRNQICAAAEGRKLERNRLLSELNHEFLAILSRHCVLEAGSGPAASHEQSEFLELETVLVRAVQWSPCKQRDDRNEPYRTINQRRYMRISEQYWVESYALHLLMVWAKRVSQSLHLGVLSPNDVMEMWRSILPWAKNNRFSYMADWFGSTPDLPESPSFHPPGRWGSLHRLACRLSMLGHGTGAKPWAIVRRYIGLQPPLEPVPPTHWRGDISALYHIIRITLEQAIRQNRVDILTFADPTLRHGDATVPAQRHHALIDPPLREALLREA